MTITRARELLGEEIADLSDEDVMAFIQSTGAICDVILDIVISDKTPQNIITKQKNE